MSQAQDDVRYISAMELGFGLEPKFPLVRTAHYLYAIPLVLAEDNPLLSTQHRGS